MRSFARLSKGSSSQLRRLFGAESKSVADSHNSVFNISDKQLEGRSIYMDLGATTPLDFRVMDAMLPFMTEHFGNPHSRYTLLMQVASLRMGKRKGSRDRQKASG